MTIWYDVERHMTAAEVLAVALANEFGRGVNGPAVYREMAEEMARFIEESGYTIEEK